MPYTACTQTGGVFAAKLIEAQVKTLSGLTGRWLFDRDDVRQELWIDLARKWPSFNPKRGSEHAFIRHVVNSRVAKLLEYAKAQCRDYRCNACSLEEPAIDTDGEDATIGKIIDIEDLLPLVGLGASSPWRISDLRVDLDAAMEVLDQAEADLCSDLLGLTILEISQLRGIPRGTLYDTLQRIREKLEPILADYLSKGVRQNENGSGNREKQQ